MIFKRIQGGLIPFDSEACEKLNKLKEGDEVMVDIKKPRNLKFHKKFFAMLTLVLNNQEKIQASTVKQGQERLLYAAMYILKRGEFWGPEKQHFERESISFASMSEDEFEDFYNEVLDVFLMYFMPKTNKEDFERELLGFS